MMILANHAHSGPIEQQRPAAATSIPGVVQNGTSRCRFIPSGGSSSRLRHECWLLLPSRTSEIDPGRARRREAPLVGEGAVGTTAPAVAAVAAEPTTSVPRTPGHRRAIDPASGQTKILPTITRANNVPTSLGNAYSYLDLLSIVCLDG